MKELIEYWERRRQERIKNREEFYKAINEYDEWINKSHLPYKHVSITICTCFLTFIVVFVVCYFILHQSLKEFLLADFVLVLIIGLINFVGMPRIPNDENSENNN